MSLSTRSLPVSVALLTARLHTPQCVVSMGRSETCFQSSRSRFGMSSSSGLPHRIFDNSAHEVPIRASQLHHGHSRVIRQLTSPCDYIDGSQVSSANRDWIASKAIWSTVRSYFSQCARVVLQLRSGNARLLTRASNVPSARRLSSRDH